MIKIPSAALALSTALASLAAAPAAQAADIMYHGTLCSTANADASKIERSQFGVHNISSSAATVWCGAAPTFGATVTKVEIEVYDRSSTDDVSCTVMGLDFAGNVFFSQGLSSSGNGAAVQTLGTSNLNNGMHTLVVVCRIPAVTSSGFSHVANYRVKTTP